MIKVVEVQLEKRRFENFHDVCVGYKFMELGGLPARAQWSEGCANVQI